MSRFLARVTPVGGDVYMVEQLSRPTDPGFGGGLGGGVDPGYGHPDWDVSHPGHPLPPVPGHPDAGLPGWERPTDPGYGRPGYGGGHPGNALPTPPVRPSPPITLPPGVWPPQLPPSVDNTLPPPPPGTVAPPIVIPPDPDYGIEAPIYVPKLPPNVAILIALPQAQPKADAPPNTKPAILIMSGKKPVLVYVSVAATPK